MIVTKRIRKTANRAHLTENQKSELRAVTRDCIDRGRRHFSDYRIEDITVDFGLRGATAGQYHPQACMIKYNASIAAQNFEEFKRRTVPHEVAHHIARAIALQHQINIKPHGSEWRAVMQVLGVADTQRCHNYDLSGTKVKRQRRIDYRCGCLLHQVSMTIHNRIRKGAIYKCRSCNKMLRLAGTHEVSELQSL